MTFSFYRILGPQESFGSQMGYLVSKGSEDGVSRVFFVYMVEARGRAGSLNGSGRNRQKQDAKHAWGGQVGHRRELQGGKTEKFEGGNLRRVNEGRKDHRFLLLMI